jgi:ABC-2 type transport system permease protein
MTELSQAWPTPAPGAAPLRKMVAAQTSLELRTLMRNAEQLILTLIIPVLLLVAFGHEALVSVSDTHTTRIDFVVPGILALAVLSTAFTSLAIGTGFERRYGVLKRLGASPLSRQGLIAAKTMTVLTVELAQAALVLVVGALLGWSPHATGGAVIWVPVLLLAGTAAFSGPGPGRCSSCCPRAHCRTGCARCSRTPGACPWPTSWCCAYGQRPGSRWR